MRSFPSAVALLAALGASSLTLSAHADEKATDYFIDATGARTEFGPAYDGWFGGKQSRPHYFKAVLENIGISAFEELIYWWDPSTNVVDWQFPNLGSKLGLNESIRFDDNLTRTNWLLHPFAGATHYSFTRANGVGILGAFAAAATCSTLYETLFEWRELISINDLIVTPFAGMAVGEFFFQLGNYLNSVPPRPRTLEEAVGPGAFGRQLAGSTLGFVRALHEDDEARFPLLADDSLGYSSAYWHRFRLLAGYDFVKNDQGHAGSVGVVGAGAELAAMPGFLQPGRISTWFSNGNFTSMNMRVAFDSTNVRDIDVLVDAHLFGHFGQHFDAAEGGVNGVAHEVAIHTALHYVDRWLFDRRDQYAMLHMLAPVATVWFGRGHTMVRLSADIAPDFAAPYSLAYEGWSARFGTEGTKSSLLSHGYYNAWGVSAGASSAVSSHGFTLSARARFGHYESLDGAERATDPVTREVHCTDEILELDGGLSYEPPKMNISGGITVAHVGRLSNMAPVTASRSDDNAGVFAAVRF